MPYSLLQPPGSPETAAVVVLALFTAGYAVHYTVRQSRTIHEWLLDRLGGRAGEILHTTLQRALMFLMFGLIPVGILAAFFPSTLAQVGLEPRFPAPVAAVTGALSLLTALAAFFNPAHRRPEGPYPQMRVARWSAPLFLYNLLTWTLYLAAYELMYRGLLLRLLLPFGVWLSVAVNTSLYAVTHLPKGAAETAGAVPLGVALCLLVLWADSLWPAFVVHLVMAACNALGAILRRPGIGFGRPQGLQE